MSSLQGGGAFDVASDGLTFGVVGSGKLGYAFITSLLKQRSLGWVLCGSVESAMKISEHFDWNVAASSDIACLPGLPNVILIAVPDSVVSSVVEALAAFFGKKLSGIVVIHCSGIFGRDILSACEAEDAITIAAHPFQTFANSSDTAFRGIAWGVECADEHRELAAAIVKRFGGQAEFLSKYSSDARGLYHAAAVFASNFIVNIIGSAKETAEAAGIAPVEFLLPIITTATENALQALDEDKIPLTGPIARGDVETIMRHIENFTEAEPEIGFEYALIARAVLESTRRRGLISHERYREARVILESAISNLRPQN